MKTTSSAKAPMYSVGEDIGNAVTHGIGAALAVAGLVLLILKSTDAWQVVASCVYGASLFLLFLMSCLYHAIRCAGGRYVMRVFDHTSIFLLIAGTYTPYTLVTFRGALGWVLFGVVWAIAVVGIVFNSISVERFKRFSMICYIASGWYIVVAIWPLVQSVPTAGLLLLLGGGVLYTIGILFYRQKTRRWFHMVWHLFVLAAAILHYFGIYCYVIG